jgi:hypothetical protein
VTTKGPWLLAVVATVVHLGCYAFTSGPRPFEPPTGASPQRATEAILRVNEAGVWWGVGDFGDQVRQRLLAARAFEQVYYPVEPRNPPRWVVEVESIGSVRRHYVWEAFAALTLFPQALGPYFLDYLVTSDVRVRHAGEVLQHFQVESSALMGFAAFTSLEGVVPQARDRVLQDLALRVAYGVATQSGTPAATATGATP